MSVLILNPDEPCWLHEQHVLRTSSYNPTRSFSSFVCTSRQSDPPLCMDNFSFFMPKCITLHLFTLKVNCHSLSFSVQVRIQTCLVKLIGNTVHNFGIVRIHVYKGSNHIRHIINATDEKHWTQPTQNPVALH